MSSTDTDSNATPAATDPAAQPTPPAPAADEPKPGKGKGKKAKAAPKVDETANDAPASEVSCSVGDTVIYTCSEDVAHRYAWRHIGADFPAIVTMISGDEVSLFVMVPDDNPFSAKGVKEGEGPHTFRVRE